MSFCLTDMGLAYRKAKVDLYYSSHPCLTAIADYEEKLQQNLTGLLIKITATDENWVTTPKFLGTWSLTTKSVSADERDKHHEDNGHGLIFSSPTEEWDLIL